MPLTDRQFAGTCRILDANLNRALEGLRTAEEFLRFVLQDRCLSKRCKELRHDLAVQTSCWPTVQLHACRSTESDVGTNIDTPQENRREDLAHVATAGLRRAAEALRCLEEYGKLMSPAADGLEQLRYQLYSLEKCLTLLLRSRQSLAGKCLYVLADGATTGDEFDRQIVTLVEAGVHLIQLRDKRLDDAGIADRARRLRRLTSGTDTLCVINDRPDIAVLVHADAVHVGQDELSPADVRAVVGPDMLVGVSTHSLDQARQAVRDGADYLGVGPIFNSSTKAFEHVWGPKLVAEVAAETTLPFFPIGGIGLHNATDVLTAGATRLAVQSAVWGAADPAGATVAFNKLLETSAGNAIAEPAGLPDEGWVEADQ